MELCEAADTWRMRSPVSGLCRLLGYTVEEVLEDRVLGSRRQRPVCELDGIRVGGAPVGVCVGVRVAFDAPDCVDGLGLRGILGYLCCCCCCSVGFPSEFISPF
jgi:hypothetical protein